VDIDATDDLEVRPAIGTSAVAKWAARHPLAAFVGLSYFVSWAWWIPLALTDESVEFGVGWPTQIPGLLGPMIGAMTVTWLTEGRVGVGALLRRMTAWRAGWWWLSIPAILTAGTVGMALAAEAPELSQLTTYQGVSTRAGALLTIVTVFVCNGLGEEAGWRGFAVDRLLQRHTLTRTSLIVAAVWAPWHLPLFFLVGTFRGFAVVEIVGWVVGLAAGSILLAWLYRGSKRSVLLVAAWHTAFNFTTATPAAAGTAAALSSMFVILGAVVVVVVDHRATTRT
jgi:membrane protease YdiL (CAAX protease family)